MFHKEVPALDSECCFEYYFVICVQILHQDVLNSLWLNYSGIEVKVALKQNPDISPKIYIHLQPNITPLTVPHHTPYITHHIWT
jgi:hypothetical protein